MSRALGRLGERKYLRALTAFGDLDVGAFVPWLGVVSSVASGAGGAKKTSEAEALKRALEEQQRREAERRARTTRILLYSLLGVVGAGLAGTAIYLVARK